MASYRCRVSFGSVRTKAFADPDDTTEREVERAVEEDAEEHYDRRPEDLERDMNISAECELAREGEEPSEFDEEVEPGIFVQR